MGKLDVKDFGTSKSGNSANLYTFTNNAGMSISVTDFGATLVKVLVPDCDRNQVDVVLGYDNVLGYDEGGVFFGTTVGRNANRIGGASFVIGDTLYQLAKNDGENSLHSGPDTYNKRLWSVNEKNDSKITFLLHSEDGDQGFPGNIDIYVTYELTEENEVKITYCGIPDQDTVINMTNHSYFNLNGHASGDILKHRVMIDADAFTPSDENSIPTGEIRPVTGTPMDFLKEKEVGKDIHEDYTPLINARGYDHNYVLNHSQDFRKVATATGDQSGIKMEVYTDLPGVHFYSANYVENEHGKAGAVYQPKNAICFETQYFPDAVHHPNFEQPICKAGENYQTSTSFKFIAE